MYSDGVYNVPGGGSRLASHYLPSRHLMLRAEECTPRVKLFTWLISTYCIIVHFGSLFRFSDAEGDRGISTLIALAILFTGASSMSAAVFRIPVVAYLSFFLLWSAAAAINSPFGVVRSITTMVHLAAFIGLAFVLSQQRFTSKQIWTIVTVAAASLLISSVLVIVDYMKWIDVPKCNELGINSRIELGPRIRRVEQATGFFARRSAMAAVYCISITMSFLALMNAKHPWQKFLFAAAGLSGFTSMLLTHNRSAVFGVLLALLVYFLMTKRVDLARFGHYVLITLPLCAGFVWFVSTYLSDHVDVYTARLAYIFGTGHVGSLQSDMGRIVLFEYAVEKVLQTPMGFGLGNMMLRNGREFSPHNAITAIVWAMGLIAFVWLPLFGRELWRLLVSHTGPLAEVFKFSLVAWLLHNMTHESLNTALAWIFLGLTLSRVNSWRADEASARKAGSKTSEIGS